MGAEEEKEDDDDDEPSAVRSASTHQPSMNIQSTNPSKKGMINYGLVQPNFF